MSRGQPRSSGDKPRISPWRRPSPAPASTIARNRAGRVCLTAYTCAPVHGAYVIADNTTNRLIGTLVLDRRPTDRPRHVTEDGEKLELSYVLRRSAWGAGFAFEAATARVARCG
ncbi:GNAT family N-acetyltransferase [Nonomuraea turkmeniaca]|uniref:GNAT family N-acetyltransferase n=1 Tax=Nonomuraea turkmeniaca TaxID=103838 RepID=UPI001B865665